VDSHLHTAGQLSKALYNTLGDTTKSGRSPTRLCSPKLGL